MSDFHQNFEKITRDVTLSILMGEFSFKSELKKLKRGSNILFSKPHWKIIQNHKKNCIVTGSCALKAFNLIERYPDDVDLILLDEKDPIINKLSADRYPGMDIEDMYGYYRGRNIYVDFFKYNGQSYTIVDGIMIQNPIEVLKTKMIMCSSQNYNRREDIYDIYYAFKAMGYDWK